MSILITPLSGYYNKSCSENSCNLESKACNMNSLLYSSYPAPPVNKHIPSLFNKTDNSSENKIGLLNFLKAQLYSHHI